MKHSKSTKYLRLLQYLEVQSCADREAEIYYLKSAAVEREFYRFRAPGTDGALLPSSHSSFELGIQYRQFAMFACV